jgi:hypothetical protein
LCELIFPTVSENATWDAPRIDVEVKMLGSDISERTILRWMRKVPRDPEPARRWAAFLRNHRKGVVRSSVDPDPSDRLFFLARNHSPIRSSSFSAAKRKRSAPGSMIKLRPLSPGWSFAHGQRENIDSLKV